MKNRFFALLAFCAVLFGAVGGSLAETKKKKQVNKNNELLALLPESDMALTLDTKRLLDEGLPQILSANQPMLNEIFGKIDQIKSQTGLDLRQFQQIAIGVTAKQTGAKNFAFEPLVLARGKFNASTVVTLAKFASNGKYREEKMGERTVYIFSPQEIIDQNKGKFGGNIFSGMIDKVFEGLSKEMALTIYDGNTLALGSLAQMRSMFETKTRISPEVLSLAARKPNAIMSMGAKMPSGLSQFIDLDNDEFGKTLDSIRQLSGSMDVVGTSSVVSLTAKTVDAGKAQELKETLDGLQEIGKVLLGGSKGADKQVYARMVENARITQTGLEVMLDLKVPQADVDVLIGQKK